MREAPVTGQERPDPRRVRDRARLIGAERVLEPFHVLGRDVRVRLVRRERAAGDRFQDREDHHGDAEEQRDRLDEPARDVTSHLPRPTALVRSYFRIDQSSAFQVMSSQVLPLYPDTFDRNASRPWRAYIQMIGTLSLRILTASA